MRWKTGTAARAPNDNRNASSRPRKGRLAGIKARVSAKPTANQERAPQRRVVRQERHLQFPIVKPVAKEVERAPAHKTWGVVHKLVAPEYLRFPRATHRAGMDRAVLKRRADRARVPELMVVMNVAPPL